MKVLRFFYAECIIPEENSDKFYLLTLERGERFTVRGRFGRRTSEYSGQGTIKYFGESHAEAERAFEKTILDRQKHGYQQESLPNVLRHELSVAGLDPTLIEPILARVHFRPLTRHSICAPAGSLVSLGLISTARLSYDEMVVRIDASGNSMAVSCEGIPTSPTAYSDLRSIAAAGMAPTTLVFGRSIEPKLLPGQPILLDVLEVSGSPVDDLPGSERILLLAEMARLIGLPVPTPVRAVGPLPAGTYLVTLDQPHRCADGSPSRFVITD